MELGKLSVQKPTLASYFGWWFETLSLFKIREERETGQMKLLHKNDNWSSEN